jgi:Protein of unknown function (DUF4199)
MVVLLWASIHLTLGSVWLLLESALGMHEDYTTYADMVVLVTIPAICAIGSAVHERFRTDGSFPYLAALKTSLLTLALGSIVMAGLWMVLTMVVMPGYTDMVAERARMRAESQGLAPDQVLMNMAIAVQVHTFPVVVFFTIVLPLLSGGLASVLAAIGIRKS